ncbi:SDR family oxidoreductase [Patulibacter sp.]|uniref:SDR family oxidoreductase n=1 Tax=Patulibacter sp. TaxID=1912859 RepID=UPI002724B953|nr:SDR family oxidoreductase [Patulibacter sp.]MDO9408697.1 SDR family oxidoreductase [Patulibacter sp.]
MSEPEIPVALVVGSSGITGGAIVRLLADRGGEVVGLARRPGEAPAGTRTVAGDLLDPEGLAAALDGIAPTHVFYTSWSKRDTEDENREVNTAMMRNLFAALEPAGSVRHVALVTGLKHYLGPFEAYGTGEVPDTPFREEEPRLDVANFYYDQEDELFAAAERMGSTWSVHRSHTVMGFAVGNAMNMGLTIGAQAALCREQDRPFVFPGSDAQWNGVCDVTDADLLAEHMVWAATSPAAADTAFNVVNGDVFRWRHLWPRIAEHLGVRPEGFEGEPRPLEQQMAGQEEAWAAIARREGLVEPDLSRVASWWHTDADLGRPFEVFADMGRSRDLGFTGHRRTEESVLRALDRYREARILP